MDVIKFESENAKSLKSFFNMINEEIENNNVTKAIVLFEDKNGCINICKTRQLLLEDELRFISHLQIDSMNIVIKENYVTP